MGIQTYNIVDRQAWLLHTEILTVLYNAQLDL